MLIIAVTKMTLYGLDGRKTGYMMKTSPSTTNITEDDKLYNMDIYCPTFKDLKDNVISVVKICKMKNIDFMLIRNWFYREGNENTTFIYTEAFKTGGEREIHTKNTYLSPIKKNKFKELIETVNDVHLGIDSKGFFRKYIEPIINSISP